MSLEEAIGQTTSVGNEIDSEGNIYFLCVLPPGSYAEGAFINQTPGSRYFILKYSSAGNYISATYLDIVHDLNVGLDLEFYRNPFNNNFYFTGNRAANQSAQIGGQNVGPGFFLASFDSNGQFLWKREANDADANYLMPYGMVFDSDNHIYLAGRIGGFSLVEFLGFSVSEPIIPSFVMKLNSTAESIIWASNHNGHSYNYGGFILKGEELALTNAGGQTFIWGTQSVFVNNGGEGFRAYIARFNKDSGACTNVSFIPGNAGESKGGTAITTDANGDYIVGGFFSGTQSFLSNSITSVGGQSDFFIAKYAATTCSLGMEDELIPPLPIYPNPVRNIFTVTVKTQAAYSIYSMTGVKVGEGWISPENKQIDILRLAAGTYLITLSTGEKHKIIKL